MKKRKRFFYIRRRALCAALAVSCLVLCARHFYVYGQDKSDFPDGFDAMQAAPKSHKLIFENAFIVCSKSRFRPAQRCRCITTVGRVCFSVGILAARHHIFTTVARMGAFGTFRARTRQFIPAHGVWSG